MDLKSLVGKTIDDKYEILSLIGAGGMGSVFKARQLDLERFVAIKFLSPSLVAHVDSAGRFEREARAIAKLEHKHIAMFYSYGIYDGGLPYIVMEFLDGVSLNRLLQNGIEWKRALKICRQVCQAMFYAHAAGILHRDIKPENIILCKVPEADWVKVVDFGLAKLADGEQSSAQKLTKTGELIGSIYYLSPEQCIGQSADERSDIYSLSCVLYQMLCGSPPFECDNPVGMIHKHANEEAQRLGEKSKGLHLPPYLEDVVMKGLSKKAHDRYQSMEQLDSDLSLIEQSKQDELSFTPKHSRRSKSVLLPLLLCCFLLLLAGTSYWYFGSHSGLCWKAHQELKSNLDRKRMIYWLKQADVLEAEKDGAAADEIRADVASALSRTERNPLALDRLNLELVREYAKKGKSSLAASDAKRSVLHLAKFNLSKDNGPQFAIDEFKSLLAESCSYCLESPVSFTHSQAREILLVSRRVQELEGEKGLLPLFELVLKAVAKGKNEANDAEIADAMFARDSALAWSSDVKVLLQSTKETENAFKKRYGAYAARIPYFLFEIVKELLSAGKDKVRMQVASELAARGLAYLRNSEKLENSSSFAESWRLATAVFLEINEPQNAYYCAKHNLVESEKSLENGNVVKALMLLYRSTESLGLKQEAESYANKAIGIARESYDSARKEFSISLDPGSLLHRTLQLSDILKDCRRKDEALNVMKVTLADIQAAVKASSGANEESCLNAEDVLLNKSYMLYGGMGKQAEAEQLMREAVHVKELLDETSETSYVWTLEDLIGCLCSERKAKDAMPFIDKLRQAPDYRILLSMDSDGHAFIGVPKAFKDQGLTDGYKTIIDWLVELGNAELHGHSPTFMHVRMILRSLIECDEIDKANRLIDEALLRYPSGPEAGTLNSLKCQKL